MTKIDRCAISDKSNGDPNIQNKIDNMSEIIYNSDCVEERNSRHGSGGLSPERGGILGSVIWTLVLSTSMKYILCYMVPEVDC